MQSIVHVISDVLLPSPGAGGAINCNALSTCSNRYPSIKSAFQDNDMFRMDSMFTLAEMWPWLGQPSLQVRAAGGTVLIDTCKQLEMQLAR